MCPTTVVPLHVQQKDHGDFMCHDDQHALLLHLTTPPCNVVIDSTVNKPTASDLITPLYWYTAGAYNRNIDKRLVRKLI